MKKTVKWHEGVLAMSSKKNAKQELVEAKINDGMVAEKKHFILLAKRAGLSSWRNAVNAIVKSSDRKDVIETLASGDVADVLKSELRTAARLVADY